MDRMLTLDQKLAVRKAEYFAFLQRIVGDAYLAHKKARNLAVLALVARFSELAPWEARKIVLEWNDTSLDEVSDCQ